MQKPFLQEVTWRAYLQKAPLTWLQPLSDLLSYTLSFALWALAAPASFLFSTTSSSFSLGSLQTYCSFCLEYSSPFCMVPPKGRNGSRRIFCFKPLGPVSASCQMRTEQKRSPACVPFLAHTLCLGATVPDRGGTCKVGIPNNATSFLPFLCRCSRGREMRITGPWQPWCRRMLAVCFWCPIGSSSFQMGHCHCHSNVPTPASGCLLIVGTEGLIIRKWSYLAGTPGPESRPDTFIHIEGTFLGNI